MLLGANECASRLFLARQAGEVTVDEVERTLSSFNDALERVLGLPAGSLTLVGHDVITEWYG